MSAGDTLMLQRTQPVRNIFRQNAVTGEWVVFAMGRKRQAEANHCRENATKGLRDAKARSFLSILSGKRTHHAPTLLQYGGDPVTGKGWDLRVIDNKFPAVVCLEDAIEENPELVAAAEDKEDRTLDLSMLYDNKVLNNTIPAVGKHEVVVESPDHNGTLALGPTARVERILRAWRERGTVLSEERLVQHIMYFKNNGGGAGASLVHPHCQIVALPIVPDNVLSRTRYAHSFYEKHGVSAFKQMELDLMTQGQHRVVEANDFCFSVVPFAAISPFHLWILPRPEYQSAHFLDITDDQIVALSEVVHRTLQRLHVCVDEPDYNMILRSAPLGDRGRERSYNASTYYCWYIGIYPRLGAGAMAGFEFGSGIFNNGNLPEDDARDLRETNIDIIAGPDARFR